MTPARGDLCVDNVASTARVSDGGASAGTPSPRPHALRRWPTRPVAAAATVALVAGLVPEAQQVAFLRRQVEPHHALAEQASMEPRVRVQILLRERDVDEGIFSGDRDRQAGARESYDALAQVLHVAAPACYRLAAVRRAEGQAIFLERARPPQGEQLRAVREDQPPAQRVRRGRGLELEV